MFDDSRPLYSIGTTAELLDVHPRTLRLYEQGGLLKPARRNNRRFYSNNDLQWIKTIRYLIHDRGLNQEGLRRLLAMIPCWEITDCPPASREPCPAYLNTSDPCWQIAGEVCGRSNPIFFPSEDATDVPKPAGEFWACIPGAVEFPRRDYVGLLDAMRTQSVDPSVRFIILGSTRGFNSDGPELEARVKRAGLEDRFVLFPEFVPRQLFFGYLRRCDIMLPLTNPGVSNYEYYRSSGISGAFNLAFGMQKPMLLDRSWAHIDDFQRTSVFHDPGGLIPALNAVAHDMTLLAAKEAEARSCAKFTFSHQQERFLQFLFG